jgi:hypothetical protein
MAMPTKHKRRLALLAAALAALALAASAQATNLVLGTSNTSNATTSLTGTTSGPEFYVRNVNGTYPGIKAESGGGAGSALYGVHGTTAGTGAAILGTSLSTAASAFSVYGLLQPSSPGANSAAVRGQSNGTNANGYGVWGSQAGQGTGVYGTAASGLGIGVSGQHLGSSGDGPGVRGQTSSAGGAGVLGVNLAGGPGLEAIVNPGKPPLRVSSSTRVPNLNADQVDGVEASGLWQLGGNAPAPPTGILGTTNSKPLDLLVNGLRAFRLEPGATSPNLIGGFSANAAQDGARGVTVAGGGQSSSANLVNDHFGTVGGGRKNRAGGADGNPATAQDATVGGGFGNAASNNDSTVPGGDSNTASGDGSDVAGGFLNNAGGDYSSVAGGRNNTAGGYGSTVAGGTRNMAGGNLSTVAGGDYSFAAGLLASATDVGSFVWADGNPFSIGSNGLNTFTARTTGGARFISAINSDTGEPTAGVELAAGGGSWSSLSDRAAKRGFAPVDRSQLLERLDRVPITRWGYRAQARSIHDLGPTAQDFYAAFGIGEDNRHITTVDADGVALAAIQGLYRENQALRRLIHNQNTRLLRLERRVSALTNVRGVAAHGERGER